MEGKTKKGKAAIAAVYVNCPYCGEGIADKKDGSFLLHHASGYEAGEVVTCDSCGNQFKMPAIIRKL